MITVAGLSPSLDLTYVVEDLRLGRIHRPVEVVRCPGGKPLNCARAAYRLGADVEVVALLGGPTGAVLHAGLVAEGIGVRVVDTPQESRTCVSIAAASTGALTEVYPHADPVPAPVWAAFTAAVEAAVRERGGWLVISGGAPRELPVDGLAELVRIGHAVGARVAVDTHGSALPAAVAQRPALVKINRDEAAELTGQDADTAVSSLVAAVQQRSGGTVVVTDGDRGAGAASATESITVHLPDVRGSYPVGSGDSFLGGLLAELDAGRPLAEALVTAAAAGTANALLPGPGRFDLETVQTLRAQVAVRPQA